jgi:tetratricopeptide (TPR) repeat protein
MNQSDQESIIGESNPESVKEEGMALFKQGARDEALVQFQKAAEGFGEQEDYLNQAEMFNNIGVIHRINRQWQPAEDALLQAEASFAELGNDVKRAQVLGNLGDLNARRKEFERAENYYSASSELFASTGAYDMQADVLRALCILQIKRRHWWEAVDSLDKSLKVRPKPSTLQRLLSWFLRFALKVLSGGQ